VNIGEAVAVQNVAAFLAGHVDHCDEKTRRGIAEDLAALEQRARKPLLGAGTSRTTDQWDALLCNVTFEEA
jgi:hypothetical protein